MPPPVLLRVHLAPLLIQPEELCGGLAIVIDLLRASSTIVHALAAGAAGVIPCETVEQARARAAAIPGALLAGEREALRIPGFDLGNSPDDFTPGLVAGRTIVFTTTNGTRAVARCSQAARVVIGCFNNIGSVFGAALEARDAGQLVHLVCAGIEGEFCREDAICAGAIAYALLDKNIHAALDNEVRRSVGDWLAANLKGLTAALGDSEGGLNLINEGLGRDIQTCAAIDSRRVLPVLDADGVIRAAPSVPRP